MVENIGLLIALNYSGYPISPRIFYWNLSFMVSVNLYFPIKYDNFAKVQAIVISFATIAPKLVNLFDPPYILF